MRALLATALLALGACSDSGPPQPPPQSEGQKARARVDAAASAFGNCVLEAAAVNPAQGDVGPAAQAALNACPEKRAALKQEVAAFTAIGRPSLNAVQRDAVAEASIKDMESGLREQAALAILNKQPGSRK